MQARRPFNKPKEVIKEVEVVKEVAAPPLRRASGNSDGFNMGRDFPGLGTGAQRFAQKDCQT